MNSSSNYFGAAIFWLYIFAALSLSSVVLYTLHGLFHAPDRPKGTAPKRLLWMFSTMALLSFATLSFNMLNVLIQSFNAWSRQTGVGSSSSLATRIWSWSITSTLFQDFGNAIVQDSVRYFWAQGALLGTLSVCYYIGYEGVPDLELFTMTEY